MQNHCPSFGEKETNYAFDFDFGEKGEGRLNLYSALTFHLFLWMCHMMMNRFILFK